MRHWTHWIMLWFSTDRPGIVDPPFIHNASILFSCSDLPQSVWLTWFKHYQWLTLDTLGLDRQPADVTDLRVARVGPLHHWLCHWWFLGHLYTCWLSPCCTWDPLWSSAFCTGLLGSRTWCPLSTSGPGWWRPGRSRRGRAGTTCPGCWRHRPPQAWWAGRRGPRCQAATKARLALWWSSW